MLPVFFTRLVSQSQQELERIGRFLGLSEPARSGTATLRPQNTPPRPVTAQPDPAGAGAIAGARSTEAPGAAAALVAISQDVLASSDRTSADLRADLTARLREVFDADSSQLGSWLGISLDCENFDAMTRDRPHAWSAQECAFVTVHPCRSAGASHDTKTLASAGPISAVSGFALPLPFAPSLSIRAGRSDVKLFFFPGPPEPGPTRPPTTIARHAPGDRP